MDNCAWPCTTANTMTNIFKPFRPWEETPSSTTVSLSTPLSKTAKKIYICSFDGCGKEFDRAFNLRTHEKIHAKDRTRDHVCRYCDAGFYGVHALSRHIASHDQIRRQQCGACGRGFVGFN
ncbi:hypothetical protein BDR26DRAFT_857859 [Obelidium mucronatum]|nr:hypothetical protein BDR26DRAFT_857859 [Obelidium mucronatum]